MALSHSPIDDTKTFVKWDSPEPEFVQQIESRQGPYSHAEILEILSGKEWTENEETE